MLRRLILAALVVSLSTSTALAASTEKKKGGGETFLQLPSITATVLRGDHQRGVLMVDIGVDVQDATLRKRAEMSVPLLRDALLREMLIYAPSIAPGGAPNPDIMALQLQRAVDRTLGKPGARVLIGSILIN